MHGWSSILSKTKVLKLANNQIKESTEIFKFAIDSGIKNEVLAACQNNLGHALAL